MMSLISSFSTSKSVKSKIIEFDGEIFKKKVEGFLKAYLSVLCFYVMGVNSIYFLSQLKTSSLPFIFLYIKKNEYVS